MSIHDLREIFNRAGEGRGLRVNQLTLHYTDGAGGSSGERNFQVLRMVVHRASDHAVLTVETDPVPSHGSLEAAILAAVEKAATMPRGGPPSEDKASEHN